MLEAVTDSRVRPWCSALPWRQRKDSGPWGGSGARFCGAHGLSPVFVQLGSRPPPWVTRVAPARVGKGRTREKGRATKEVVSGAIRAGSRGYGWLRSLDVALRADLTGEARSDPFSQFFCKPSGCGPEGSGVPMVSGRWAFSWCPAARPGLHLLVAWGSQSSRYHLRFCSLAVGLYTVDSTPKLPCLE